jgi:thioredoxin reductase
MIGGQTMNNELPVAVVGGGPVGLAAAAHLVERDMPFIVLEAGDDVGSSIASWAHVRLFSPWRHNIDRAARRLLESAGWQAPDEDTYPTGGDLIEQYLRPLATHPTIAESLRLEHKAIAVGRLGIDKLNDTERDTRPFVITAETPTGVKRFHARAVIDATGTWRTPNPLGADGFDAIGEPSAADRIAYGIPDVLGTDRDHYAGRRVAVVGSGHSAQNAVRDLALVGVEDPATAITWVIRRAAPGQMFGGDEADQLPERGKLGADARRLVDGGQVRLESGFRIDAVEQSDDGILLRSVDRRRVGPFDEVIAATGFRPDLTFLRELRLDLDPALESSRSLAPLIDPNVHSCGTVPPHGEAELRHPEPNVYLVGAKSYGRAPTFLLATGYEQVRSVVAELAGDHEAARRVELALPETGVCSTSTATGGLARANGRAPVATDTAPVGEAANSGRNPASVEAVAAAGAVSSCCGPVAPGLEGGGPNASCCAPLPVAAMASSSACCG